MIKNEEKLEKKKIRDAERGSREDAYQYAYDGNGRMDTMGADDYYDDYDEGELSDEGDMNISDNEEQKGIEVDMNEMEEEKDGEDLFKDDEDEQVDLLADLIKESKDKGLADLETGSEVYMSEMLGFEIEDAEEMEEQNEEDLISLQDPWGNIELKQYVIDGLKKLDTEEHSYITSCVKHLESDDKELWDKYIATK